MLSYFPDPYPDEILYSVFSRYHVRSGNLSPTVTARELFGTKRPSLSMFMPQRIDNLIGNILKGSMYTAEDLIFANTMYPFYTAFLNYERVLKILEGMKGSNNMNECQMAGINSQPCNHDFLRFCPSCVKDDLKMFGETYWHRLHQVSGVFLCPVHNEMLLDSKVFIRSAYRDFYPADKSVCSIYKHSLNFNSNTFEQLLNLARDIEWIFKNHTKLHYFHGAANKYMIGLIKKGFTTTTGNIKRRKLHSNFLDLYSNGFLKLIGSEIEISSESWITKILTENINGHPVRHLLLIRYLYGSCDAFFESNHEHKPFGEGPWPCLNKISDHYLAPLIKTVGIHAKPGNRHITGVFECKFCGFTYSRYDYGRDLEKEQFRIGHINNYGSFWENKLRQCLERECFSVSKTAKVLKAAEKTVIKYAKKLGISLNYNYSESKQYKVKPQGNMQKNDLDRFQKTKNCREKWLELQENNKSANRSSLNRMDHATFSWLYYNDRDWLEQNSPPPWYNKSTSNSANWDHRDNELLETVKKAVDVIMHSPDKPEKVTLFSVYKKSGYPTLLKYRSNLEKLPKTKVFLIPYLNDDNEFYQRRIKWAAKSLYEQGKTVTVDKVYVTAGVLSKRSSELDEIIKKEIAGIHE